MPILSLADSETSERRRAELIAGLTSGDPAARLRLLAVIVAAVARRLGRGTETAERRAGLAEHTWTRLDLEWRIRPPQTLLDVLDAIDTVVGEPDGATAVDGCVGARQPSRALLRELSTQEAERPGSSHALLLARLLNLGGNF